MKKDIMARLLRSKYKLLISVYVIAVALVWLFNNNNLNSTAVFSLLFAAFHMAALFCSNTRYKYTLCTLGYITFITFNALHIMTFQQFESLVFYLPVMYAYILPDGCSPIISGIGLTYLFFTGEVKSIEMSVALITVSILVSILSRLIILLVKERNKYLELSKKDSLTGLPNFSHTLELGRNMLNDGKEISLMVVNLDRFKQINDTFGHLIGNKVLTQVASLLKKNAEKFNGIAGRMSGDEFIILIQNYTTELVSCFIKSIRGDLEKAFFDVDPELSPFRITIAIGEAHSTPDRKASIEELLQTADKDMYYKKYQNRQGITDSNRGHAIIPLRYRELLRVMSEKDMYTHVHSRYTAYYASMLAKRAGFFNNQVNEVYIGAWMHDIGKLAVSNDILRKTGKLTDIELDIIKRHSLDGLNILSSSGLSDTIKNCVLLHHERWDGKGYPHGISRNDIPLEARITQIADSFSAMTIKRVYRLTLAKEEALKEILRNSGTQFDPMLAKLFVNMLEGRD